MPQLLSDNNANYVADDLAYYLVDKDTRYDRSAPFHPQTQRKIESWRQTLKNRILLGYYFYSTILEVQVKALLEQYNHERYYQSLSNETICEVIIKQ